MKAIDEFLTQIQKEQIELHSCIIKKKENYLYKEALLPYSLDQPQMLFSISKSFVSLAIGYLFEEKRLRLNDAVLDFFPEYFLKASPYLHELKIIHLLTMTSGNTKEQAIFNEENWVEAYFKQTFTYRPGQYFHYNNMDVYLLSVIITKITGLPCNEYLYEKLFKPLEIDYPHWDVCCLGYNTGGWGLYLSPNDLAKIAEALVTQNPILPLKYLDKMINKKVTLNQTQFYKQGYGFLCWLNPENMGARFEGIFGQLVLFSTMQECFMIITANCLNTSKLYPLLFDLWGKIVNEDLEESCKVLSFHEKSISVHTNQFNEIVNELYSFYLSNISILPIPIRFLEKQTGVAESFMFIQNHHQLLLHWEEHHTHNRIHIGMDESYRYSKVLLYEKVFTVAALGWFETSTTLHVRLVFLEYPYSRELIFNILSQKKIVLYIEEFPSVEEVLNQYAYMLSFTPFVQLNTWLVERRYHLIAPNHVAIKKRS